MKHSNLTALADLSPDTQTFLDDVVEGLTNSPRSLPCKYFYDERGSQLFDEICGLDEYYLTRAELDIMRRYAGKMSERIGAKVMLVEFGSGSSVKTRLLLDHLQDPSAYVPIDISREHLHQTAVKLATQYPTLDVLPVCADFLGELELPQPSAPASRNVIYFPGSTIGNFVPSAAQEILESIARLCGADGGLLIGIDLKKDPTVIEAAYNDAQGVTAAFNLNLLERINSELDADIEVDQFEHSAHYNPSEGRVEIFLVSNSDQTVTIGDETFDITEGESILTEYSHKYSVDEFAALAAKVGMSLEQYWTDAQDRFAVLYFEMTA